MQPRSSACDILRPEEANSMRKAVGTALVVLLVVAVGAGGVWYWRTQIVPGQAAGPAAGAPPGKPAGGGGGFAIPVEAAKVTVDRIVQSVPAVGTLSSNDSVILGPEVTGRVAELDVKEGEQVAAGTVIALLDQSVYKAQVAEREASLALSKANFGRADQLMQKNYGTAK